MSALSFHQYYLYDSGSGILLFAKEVNLWSPLIPCFGLMMTSARGLQARIESWTPAQNGFLRFICGPTPADLLTAKPFRSMYCIYLQIMYPQASVGFKPRTSRACRGTDLSTFRQLRLSLIRYLPHIVRLPFGTLDCGSH